MATYSTVSERRLLSCDPRLQRVFRRVLELGFDHSILCGHRGQQEQDAAFAAGNSKKKWPNGEHNKIPSRAVDAQPYPARTKDKRWAQNCILFAGVVMGVAAAMGIKLRWGGDWDMDKDMTDENGLIDFPHFELEE